MLTGLWSVAFKANNGINGSGILVFEDKRIVGGDDTYYYLGTYEAQGTQATGRLTVRQHAGQSYSVANWPKEFTLLLSGIVEQPLMELTGHSEEDPRFKIRAKLRKLTDLPDT